MKKHLFVASALVAGAAMFVTPAKETTAASYGMAGCGLGSVIGVWKNDITQIFAATTNGTSASQTFGITTGTSNCTPGGAAYREKQQEIFVTVNFESLEKEMASGKGEKIDAFSNLLGCKSSTELGRISRENYSRFFGPEATPASLLKEVKAKVGESCTL